MDKQELEKIFREIDWEEYKQYLIAAGYSKGHIRNMYYFAKKYVLNVLLDPTHLSRLHWKTARHVLNALSVLQDYLDMKGVELVVNWRKLRKYLPEKMDAVDIFEYVDRFGGRLIDRAMDQIVWNEILHRSRFYNMVALTAFFTGLRGPEIRHLFMNKSKLEARFYKSVAIIQLNYIRPKKKAYVTMMPRKLYQVIPESYVGVNIDRRLRERGVYLSLMRKVHRNILSRTMDDAEIDLLQGRLEKIIVVHYTRHIYDIAIKYEKAFQSYYKIIDITLRNEDENNQDNPGGRDIGDMGPPAGFEPATSGYLQ